MLKNVPFSSQNSLQIICFLFFVLLLSHPLHSYSDNSTDAEKAILLKLKKQWLNPDFLRRWVPSSDHCTWTYITCDNGTVTEINMYVTGIIKTIPSLICDLKNLMHINLHFDYIEAFPTSLSNCSKLKYLDLSHNSITGSIPENINRLLPPHLGHLDLSYNGFGGSIPEAIGNMTALQHLDLAENGLTGSIPGCLFELKKLRSLSLKWNNLSGSLPQTVEVGLNLEEIDMRSNNLIGTIPDDFGKLRRLSNLVLSFNQLWGQIPTPLAALPNLSSIDLRHNRLSGQIPSAIGHSSKSLLYLDLSENQFSGEIPPELWSLSGLSQVDLSNNKFSGEISPGVGNLGSLGLLSLGQNNFFGQVPPELWSLSSLRQLDLSDNHFSGEIPPQVGNLLLLDSLLLSNNKFYGEIPPDIGNLLSLGVLDLSHNYFSGKVPPQLWELSSLHQLNLSGNKFSGVEISPRVWSSLTLRILDLSQNSFSGNVPPQLWRLYRLELMDLSDNKFSSEIHPQIMNLSLLVSLNLSSNKFSGSIPPEISQLTSLQYLDLSMNRFSGNIPIGMLLPRLHFLNLSSNLLCVKITANFKYPASLKIFDYDIPSHCKSNPPLGLSRNRFAILVSIAAMTFLLTGVFTSYILRRYKLKRYSTWKTIPFQKLDFPESTIISGLTEDNLIGSGGSGSVYRVHVNNSGEYAAVKRIHNKRKMDERLEKQFLSEVQILGTIRHLHILRLMCYISSEKSKLLVYEYMENGSLHKWLHCKRRPFPVSSSLSLQNVVLEWPKRLRIAIGVAEGLCYMHHSSSSPIIHRDLKSSNILLDTEFNAKIADFGLAKFLCREGFPSTMSIVAGTLGYIAPEYSQTTRVTEKVDVYSFGVILLELVTGRQAHQGDENSSLAEWAWRHIQLENPIVDALAEDIKDLSNLEEMVKVFKLGIYCTQKLPSNRPSMRNVQEILYFCAHPSAPRDHSLVPVPINTIRETRTIVFSLRTGREIFES